MADVRELLARLNPANVKFDTGRGGLPELTNQDIAGALAFIPAGLGREVFIACHWPDGAKLSRRRITAMFQHLALTEYRKRLNRLTDARVDHGIAVSIRRWEGAETAEQRAEVYRTQARLDLARDELWPDSLPEMLPALLKTIIEEVASPRNCAACEGRGAVIAGELLVECKDCAGTGHAKNSDGWRAKKLGKDPANFRRDWRPCYQWLFERVRDAESEAAQSMTHAVQRDAA
ncbi:MULTISPECIES: hypothetical protein [Xanthomonas]|uniref:Phage-related protein n=2 Tax=Xanthomonas TaxID=338 RepID=A0A7Z7IYK3_XANCH|nr:MULTISPECIES: hypothetical protein [Xanthomonas]ATS39265.1 hypothetical protein XcfCFBP6988P_14980 [Xanthomonas citri pv. phaseoli var. fuscans]ATS41928.1 hypothetical protein XcfCFBP6989P_05510 [Xanthomonas citri pv. phaseoli var. fuscans]ATS47268.1 hypothetical protein XcfCFBP6990P_11850 [Xanthomonas citri pv. phaseoli var. fuscans]ATS86353.1 hypothetical protein XcfCFBP6991P_22380 [Xanthomonas citri pv. phaseoli var. fuscans]QWN20910.1 hypothetical protein DGM98_12920 [Xanthomonas citri]